MEDNEVNHKTIRMIIMDKLAQEFSELKMHLIRKMRYNLRVWKNLTKCNKADCFITPFGVAASVNHAVLVDDLVELVARNKCPECGYEGDTFMVQGRIQDKEGLGCSSLVEWI